MKRYNNTYVDMKYLFVLLNNIILIDLFNSASNDDLDLLHSARDYLRTMYNTRYNKFL